MYEKLDPERVIQLLASQLPAELYEHLLLVGSLAAAYHFRAVLEGRAVNTKDADVIVQPAGALQQCQAIANELLSNGWIPLSGERTPGDAETPAEALPVIRLLPPRAETDSYFVELLALPERGQREPKELHRCELQDGTWWIVPSFRFMALLRYEQQLSAPGLPYAAPSMMALSNLLAHPTLGSATMSMSVDGLKNVKRSAKDLGRVLGLAWLAGPETDDWPAQWDAALRTEFPGEFARLAMSAAGGLRELVASPSDLAHAQRTLAIGILAGKNVNIENLIAVADELLESTLPQFEERTTR